jgi:hypothetical protein
VLVGSIKSFTEFDGKTVTGALPSNVAVTRTVAFLLECKGKGLISVTVKCKRINSCHFSLDTAIEVRFDSVLKDSGQTMLMFISVDGLELIESSRKFAAPSALLSCANVTSTRALASPMIKKV